MQKWIKGIWYAIRGKSIPNYRETGEHKTLVQGPARQRFLDFLAAERVELLKRVEKLQIETTDTSSISLLNLLKSFDTMSSNQDALNEAIKEEYQKEQLRGPLGLFRDGVTRSEWIRLKRAYPAWDGVLEHHPESIGKK